MTFRLILAFLWMARIAPAQSNNCVAVEGDRLLARDFAAALPAFGSLPPETAIAPAPSPGVRRVFHAPEMQAVARRFSLSLIDAPDLCFEWVLQPLNRAAVLDAMRAALPIPDLQIEIVEASSYPTPAGTLEFRREDLGSPADPSIKIPVLWRGSILYGARRRFSIWARVQVSGRMPRVVAIQPLKHGEPIREDQVRVETATGFPSAGDFARRIEDVLGSVPWRDIGAGVPIRLGHLTKPPEVGRGDMVEVEIRNGGMRLAITAKAESAGRSGELIRIRNLSSNRVFQARVSGKDKAVVEQGGSDEN